MTGAVLRNQWDSILRNTTSVIAHRCHMLSSGNGAIDSTLHHWHETLPGRVLDVQYEQMVGDQQTQTRRLLEYCELPWEDNCLRFYENKRAVNTASSEQVRQPIYSKSVNSWRRYEAGLAPLIEVLEPLLLQLPVEDRPSSLQ